MLEALAVGRPVLTTAWVGSGDLIVDDALGKTIDTRNPGQFAEAMIEMISHPYDHQRIATLFEKHFGAHNTIHLLEEKFRRVLG